MSKKKTNSARDDYEVGYRRPPRRTQFKKGQSGNPRGRPKGARNNRTLVDEILSEKIEYKQNGKVKKAEHRDIMLRRALQKALQGDLKAMAFLFQHDPKSVPEEVGDDDAPSSGDTASDKTDREIIEHFLKLNGGDAAGLEENAGESDVPEDEAAGETGEAFEDA